jgi:hypothetical protein
MCEMQSWGGPLSHSVITTPNREMQSIDKEYIAQGRLVSYLPESMKGQYLVHFQGRKDIERHERLRDKVSSGIP